jgi:hypothetical protein
VYDVLQRGDPVTPRPPTQGPPAEGWRAETQTDIAATPERVWTVVSDFSRHPALAGSGEVLTLQMHGPLEVGATFDSEVRTGEIGSFSPRCEIEVIEEYRYLGWVSLFPLDEDETPEHQIEVHWRFGLEPSPTGTRLSHSVHIPPPKAGADELAEFFARTDRMTTVRDGMRRTLANTKAAAETGDGPAEL